MKQKNISTKAISEFEEFTEQFPVAKFKKGELIYRPGDAFTNLYAIKSGLIRLYSIAKNGKEVTFNIFGKSITMISLINATTQEENLYYYEAVTPVEARRIPKDKFMEYVSKTPELLVELSSEAFTCFQRLLSKIEYLIAGDSHSKVASVIYYFADNYGRKKNGEILIDFALPHRLIASLTGLTRETVTIQMLNLEKMKLIRTEGRRLFIVDMDALKEESAFDGEE